MADGVLRASDYDDYTTGLCERAQLTLLKCAGHGVTASTSPVVWRPDT